MLPDGTAEIAAESLVKLLELSAKKVSELPSHLRRAAELHNFLSGVTQRYYIYARNLYSGMRILAMQEPVSLQNMYMEVRLSSQLRSKTFKTEAELVREFLRGGAASVSDSISAIDALNTHKNIVLLGAPGSGKSTLLRYSLLEDLTSVNTLARIPILISLNQINDSLAPVRALMDRIFAECGVVFSTPLVEKLLLSGRLRILIDGLDEVRGDSKGVVVNEIRELQRIYPKCAFVVSCRSSAYEYWFENVINLEVERFSESAIVGFVGRWFEDFPQKAVELRSQIQNSTRLRDLCSNPLMLTVVCTGFASGVDVSNNRGEIYREAIEVLLKTWDASRGVFRDNPYKIISPKRRIDLLAHLAHATFRQNLIIFGESHACEIVSSFLETVPRAKGAAPDIEALSVLEAVQSQHGLVERRGRGYWGFAHLTFQEFFTATSYLSKNEAEREELVTKFIYRPEWREVLLLIATLLPNADLFILSLLGEMTKVGYGASFLRRLHDDILLAREKDVLKYDRKGVDRERVESRRIAAGFSVIEGGIQFELDETKRILDGFRAIASRRLEALPLDKIMANARPGRAFDNDGYVAHAVRRRVLPHIEHLKVSKNQILATNTLNSFIITFLSKIADINRAMSPARIFEITDRKHMHLVPECADEIWKNVEGKCEIDCMEELIVPLNKILSSERLSNIDPIINQEISTIIRALVRRSIEEVAYQNEFESVKIKAFMIGELLAEMLLSPVFLSQKVRDVAIRTLENMVQDVPTPPDGPSRGANVQAVGLG